MDRAKHLAWCKSRALEYVHRGDLPGAVTSMVSDMRKHPETDTPMLAMLMMVGLKDAQAGDRGAVTRWVEGFN